MEYFVKILRIPQPRKIEQTKVRKTEGLTSSVNDQREKEVGKYWNPELSAAFKISRKQSIKHLNAN